MRKLLAEYRGWEIFFDTDKEEFYTVSNEHDTDKVKKSYSATIKFIDDYIKDNQNFKPISVQKENGEKVTLIGMRKDGRFMCVNEKEVKSQLPSYYEDSYFLTNPINEPVFKEIFELEEQQKELYSKITKAKASLIKVSVSDLRNKLLGK